MTLNEKISTIPGGALDVEAGGIVVTPSGNLASNNVQDALVELQTELDTKTKTYVTVGFSNADYICDGTNDNIEIMQAQAYLNSLGGGVLYIKRGIYNISTTMYNYSNIHIIGEGDNTELREVGAGRIFYLNTTNNWSIKNLKINGNRAGGFGGGFFINTCSNFSIKNVKVIDTNGGIQTDTCSDYLIEECIADGCWNWNFYNYKATRGKLYNNKSLNAKADTYEGFGIAFYKNFTYCEAIGNYVYNPAGNGLQFNSGASATIDCIGNIAENNVVINSANRGLFITTDGSSYQVKNIIVRGNKVIGSAWQGIYCIQADGAIFKDNYTIGNGYEGIISEESDNVQIEGNTSNSNTHGIYLKGTSTGSYVGYNYTNSNSTVGYRADSTATSLFEYNTSASDTTEYNTSTNLVIKHNSGNVGIGQTTPTAVLHIKAGTTTAGTAPIKLGNGTILTSPESGVHEFSNEHFLTNSNIRFSVGGQLFQSFTDVSVGGDETDIFTNTLAAATFNLAGAKVIASYGGNFVTVGTEVVQLKVYFAGTAIWDSTGIAVTTGTTSWSVDVKLIRVSSSTVRYNITLNTTGASGFVCNKVGELTGLTLSGTNILKITGTSSGVGSGVGDIVGKMRFIEFKPAA